MTSLLDELRWRELLQDATQGVEEHLAEGPREGYIGFDPTARSLHVGSLLVIMGLVHLQRAGHTPIALVGGGTGLIGDPSGKTAERQLLTPDAVAENAAGIRAQLEHFLDFDGVSNAARMRNNLDWLGGLKLVEFLRDIGKHFSVNQMMARESVKRRLENEETGISYTEFSYALLQSFDFLELYRREGCTVQMGGSDQWGNITAGIDLVRRVEGGRAYGAVMPLVTNASGAKFGKSEGGNVWLDAELTSPYAFYQFWVNTEDADVVRYLKYFTLMPRERIAELADAVEREPHRRAAQKALAEEVTERVHGASGLDGARRATDALFGGSLDGLGSRDIEEIFADVPSTRLPRTSFEGEGMPVVDLLVDAGVASSKGDARRSLDGGGIYLNNVRQEGPEARVTSGQALDGRYLVLRKGKRNYHLVELLA